MKPNQIIIICGDFNFKRKPFDLFYEIIPPHIYTFQRKKINTMVKSRTDHILTFPLIESVNKYEFNGYSDHCLIKIEFKIKPSTRQQFYFHKFNKVNAKNLNNLAASKFSDFTCFYNFIKLNLRKSKVILKVKKPIVPKLNYSFEKADLFSKLAQLIKNDKNAFFKLLKTITILNPFKKENSIYSYFIDDSNRLQFGDAAMNNCLEQLSLISKGQQLKPKRLPSLPPLEDFDIFDIQKGMSYNKAITYDGISDNFLRQTKNIHILKNIWSNNTIETNLNCCRARIIPLNKVYPDIPNKSQFRPITILSPLFKFLELRFLPKLQMYLLKNLFKEQTGFIPFSSTQINIINLLNKINNFQKRDKMNCVVIDFSNAFNSIDRNQLFQILRQKKILDQQEINFLDILYQNLYYVCPLTNKKYHFANGVPQGSPLSPALFNIYMENFLSYLKQSISFEYESYQFADDIVYFVRHCKIQIFLQTLLELSLKHNLQINKLKSGIFLIQNHSQVKQLNIQDFPIVTQYKYLGVTICSKGKINLHLDKLQKNIQYISKKLQWLSQSFNWKQKHQLFQIFILPHILYICPAIATQRYKKTFLKLQQLYKSSYKRVCGFPISLPNSILEMLIHPLDQIIAKHTQKVIQKIQEGGFHQSIFYKQCFLEMVSNNSNFLIIKFLPTNFNKLFLLYNTICPIHLTNCTFQHITNFHLNIDIIGTLMNMNEQKNLPAMKRLKRKLAKIIDQLYIVFRNDQ